MPLSTAVNNAVTAAYAALGDLVQTVTLRTYAAGSYDPATGAHTPGSSTDTPVDAVVTRYMDDQIDGTLIRQGDRRVIARTAIAVQTHDECLIGGVVHEVIFAKPINPGGTTFATILQVRR